MRVPRFIEAVLLGRWGFSSSAQQTSGYRWAVPYVRQRHANMCGNACVQMLSQYYGWGIAINMKSNPRGAMEGFEVDTSTYAARFAKLLRVLRVDEFENHLRRYGPLMCAGDFAAMGIMGTQGHWVVVKGADNDNFWIHDPWHGSNIPRSKVWFIGRLDRDEVFRPIP